MTAQFTEGMSAKILTALNLIPSTLDKIPAQIADTVNATVPEVIATALADALISLNERIDSMEAEITSIKEDFKLKTEHLQVKVNDMAFIQ